MEISADLFRRRSNRGRLPRMAAVVLFLAPSLSFGQFPTYTGCNGQPASGLLAPFIVSLNPSSGAVQINGADSRGPNTPFTWNWGDSTTTQGWFPQSHTYANVQQNYTLQVVSHEIDGSTDCAQLPITFVPNPTPSITALLPSSSRAFGGPVPIIVTGSNFVPSSIVTFGGTTHISSFVDSTRLAFSLGVLDNFTLGLTPGSYAVVVTNPPPGGGVSNSITFTVAPVTGLGFLPPAWQAIGPTKIPNSHACDNDAEASLLAAGRIQAFAINLGNPAVMYGGGGVGTGNSGPTSNAGVYKSTDRGMHWLAQDNGLTDRYVDALWLDQSNPDTVLASTWFGGIFRSTDGAQSWTNVRASSTTSIVQAGSILLAAAGDGIAVSSDAGSTWTLQKATASPVRTLACGAGACYAGLDDGTVMVQPTPSSAWVTVLSGTPGATAYDVAVNPADPSEAIVVLNGGGNIVLGEGGPGLSDRITRNGGATWSAFNTPPQQSGGRTFNCSGGTAKVVAFDTVNPNIIYAGLGGAMWVSADGGASWTALHLYEDLNLIYPFPGQSGTLVVGGDQGIYMSQDRGATWATLNGDLTTSLLTHLAVNGAEIFTAVQDFSPIQSFDGGNSWVQLSGLNSPQGEDGVVVINPGNPQYQYAFNGSGLWYSSDGGKNFTNDYPNLSNAEWTFNGTTDYIAVDPTSPQHLYLVGASGVFESTDYGVHWHLTGWPISNPTFVVVDPNDSKTIFVGSFVQETQASAVFFTHDGGATWKAATLPASAQHPTSLAVDPSESTIVVLGMNSPPSQPGGGVLLSMDGGKTFTSDNRGLSTYASLSPYYVGSVRFAPSSLPHVVAAATTSGLYLSRAGGAWTDITGNTVPRWFSAVTWTADSLYAATFGEGVLRTPISAITPVLSISPTSANVGGAGGTGSVGVLGLAASAMWTATATVAWITVTSGASGSGNGTVNYLVAPNPSANPRTGTITIGGYVFTVLQASTQIPASPTAAGPASGSGTVQTFIFTFSDTGGYQNLGVVDVLINSVLDGRQACYVAFVPSGASTGSVYLVDDAGDAGGPYSGMLLPGSGSVQNSQCSISGLGSSVSGNGNTLTVTLAITFASSFAGNKVIYTSAQDKSSANSGWQVLGTWGVPGPAPAGPWVGGVSPGRSSSATQTYTFTFADTNGWQDITVANVLINSAIDGRYGCYVAFAPASGSVFLVDDAGDAGGPYSGMVLPGSGSVSNSQCTISAAGSSFAGGGNTLTLMLAVSFNQSFAGNQVLYLAARSNTLNSGWQAVGSVAVP